METQNRRYQILKLLENQHKPVSGSVLSKLFGVSRQVVVQDIALLRSEGHSILATARGYLLDEPKEEKCSRLFKVYHDESRTEEELNLIVDLGGVVEDVMVNHKVYNKVSAPLNIKNRRDVQNFLKNLKEGKSTPLSKVTSGYHFHHVSADEMEILNEIEDVLRQNNFLTEVFDYEME